MQSFTTYIGKYEIETDIYSNGKTISVAFDDKGFPAHGTESIAIESVDSLRKMIAKLN